MGDLPLVNPAFESILQADRNHLWHPYTQMQDRPDPLVVTGAQGCSFTTSAGQTLLDGTASWWVAALGHRHPRLVAALTRQAGVLPHIVMAGNTTHGPAAELAERLIDIAPGKLNRVFYSDDGSTAVEVALKIAFQFFQQNGQPRRNRFVAFTGSFHGETIGAVSLGGVAVFHQRFAPLLFTCDRLPSPGEPDGDWEQAAQAMERHLSEHGEHIAAVVIEPLIQGAVGMWVHPPEYLRRLRAACDKAGCLLIADEVFVGYGRTGTFWACDGAGIAPDLLTTGKGFAGGMLPIAATLATEEVFAGFLGNHGSGRALYYGHSFYGNPLGTAVALETLKVFEEERVMAHVQKVTVPTLTQGLAAIAQHPKAHRPRQVGAMIAFDLDPPGTTSYLGDAGPQWAAACQQMGLYARPLGSAAYLVPPLVADKATLTRMTSIALDALDAIEG